MHELFALLERGAFIGWTGYWSWRHSPDWKYLVCPTYLSLSKVVIQSRVRSELASNSLNLVWHCWAPYKVQVFPKKLIIDRALTRPNLFKLKVISDPVNTLCQLCDGSVE